MIAFPSIDMANITLAPMSNALQGGKSNAQQGGQLINTGSLQDGLSENL